MIDRVPSFLTDHAVHLELVVVLEGSHRLVGLKIEVGFSLLDGQIAQRNQLRLQLLDHVA
jgi:hypothetical protein